MASLGEQEDRMLRIKAVVPCGCLYISAKRPKPGGFCYDQDGSVVCGVLAAGVERQDFASRREKKRYGTGGIGHLLVK